MNPDPQNNNPTEPLPPQDEPSREPAPAGRPQEQEQPPPAPGAAQPAGFFAWIRSLNTVRSQDRWIGGVAGGIALRTGLDTVLVRGLFVLLAIFGGVGVLLYGLAWALLPEPDGRIHTEQVGRGAWTGGTTGALVLVILGFFGSPFGFFDRGGWENGYGGPFWGLLWTAAIVGLIVWAARRGRSSGRPTAPYDPAGPYPAQAYPAGTYPTQPFPSQPYPTQPYPTQPFASQPYAGEPDPGPSGQHLPNQGAAMSYQPPAPPNSGAPYYPQPAPPPVPPRPRPVAPSGSFLAIVLGTALFVAAVITAWERWGNLDLNVAAPVVAAASALTIIGVGIAIAGLRGRSSGALGVFGILALVATLLLGALTAGAGYWHTSGTNRFAEFGASRAENGDGYDIAMGSGTIDLTDITRASLTADRVIPVEVAFGNVDIIVPSDIPVIVRPESAFASITVRTAEFSQETTGVTEGEEIEVNPDASGPRLILQIEGAFSNVTVTTQETENTK